MVKKGASELLEQQQKKGSRTEVLALSGDVAFWQLPRPYFPG
jgi:hypothetical protein